MINEKSTLSTVFKEARERIDGLVTVVLIILSAFVSIFIAALKAIRLEYFEFNWVGLIVLIIAHVCS